jgi:hypothetical protein
MADKAPIQAYIENRYGESIGGFTIHLPATKETLQPWLDAIGAKGEEDIAIIEAVLDTPKLEGGIRKLPYCESFNELNYLAAKVQSLDAEGSDMLMAFLDTGIYFRSVKDFINLTESTGAGELQPASSLAQYGEFLAECEKDRTAKGFEKLKSSDDPELHALTGYIETLEKYIDKEKYCRDIAENEGGRFTKAGYLIWNGEMSEAYRGTKDIPDEYRVFTATEQLAMAKDVDIPQFITAIHSFAGNYKIDLEHSLATLAALRSSEYLLIMDGCTAYLTEAAHAYRHGTDEHGSIMAADEGMGAMAYSIHLTQVHGDITGDIALLDLRALQRDIAEHSIKPVMIQANLQNGDAWSYLPEDWDALSMLEKNIIRSWRREFSDGDFSEVRRHVDERWNNAAKTHKTVQASELLAMANGIYMTNSKYRQADMLRVPQLTAKELLAHSDAGVYQLLPSGPEKLTPMDAVRHGLWFSECREFAIKRSDMPEFIKWAEHKTIETLNHIKQRDEPEKKHGQEI